jgi:hypothetical protein
MLCTHIAMQTQTKTKIYIVLFVVFGILLGLVIHGVLELWYIGKLTTDFAHYSLSHTWAEWFLVHKYFSIILFVLSVVFGFFQGRLWWRLVYVEGRLDPFFNWLKRLVGLRK